MPRKRAGYGRWTSGYWIVTGLRKRFRSVTAIARLTALTSCPASLQNPDAGRPPLSATGASQGDDEPGRQQQDERRRQQELPRDRQDLIDADPHEGPAYPGDDQEDQERLEHEPHGPERHRPGPEPAAQEEEGAEEARPEHVRVLAQL